MEAEVNEISKYTQEIAKSPYDPEPWLFRGRSLRLLGFPELSLGDVYKARLLTEAALERTSILGIKASTTFEQKVLQLHLADPAWASWKHLVATPEMLTSRTTGMLKQLELQIWTELMEGLMASNACSDYLQLSREAVIKFPSDKVFPSEVENAESWFKQREVILQEQIDSGEIGENQMQSTLYNGGVFPVAYPWMSEDLVSRSEELVLLIKQEFKESSTNCTVARSALGNGTDEEETSSDKNALLGVIALQDIMKGTAVLIDATVAGVTTSSDRCASCCGLLVGDIRNQCCNVRYCSTICSELALKTFHSTICGKDFRFLFEAAKSADLTTDLSIDSLLLLRVLALSIHEGATHPLQTSILKRLTPTYDVDHLIIFNFPDHIITPIRILQELDVDVFANPAYDTWILHTMRCRIQNNKHGQTLDGFLGSAVNPLYSMFNHSCSPNVDWEHEVSNSTLRLFCLRDVVKGEELFISYIKPLDMEREQRQQALMPWWGQSCNCTRCEVEDPDK